MKLSKTQKEILQNQLNNEKGIMKSLKEQYSEALEQINNKITSYQSQIGVLQQGDTSDPVIASMIQSKAYQKQYQQALKDQISGILDTLNGKQFDSISDYLTQCYQNGFIGVAYDLASQGIPLIMPIDQAAVVQAISTNSKLSKGLYESLGENISDMKKKVVQEITRGVASNLPYADIARNIAGRSNAGMNNSMRIARTEGQRIQNTAAYDAQVKAKKKGADVFKQWCATLDGRTRDTHRQLDGKIVEVGEEFEIGGLSAMFPGDFGDPAEDCNCRCTILQRARWALDESELETLKERAEYFGLDKTEDFEDFKEKYLNASQNGADSGSVRSDVQKISGGTTKIKQSGGKETGGKADDVERRSAEAKSYYDKIKKQDDVEAIAEASGMKREEIQRIKEHIFVNNHIRYDGSYAQFDPDYDMAVAWKRLSEGRPEERDLLLLRHELLESEVEKMYNLTASEAHALANKQYNWEKELYSILKEGEADGLL